MPQWPHAGAFSGPDASPARSPRTCAWSRTPSCTAVGSRSQARAAAFAQEHGFAAAYGSYEELLADESVDAVYVASPHALHVEHVTAALASGKHVLCEKPLTLRAGDAEQLFALARRRERLLMEAMWTACHPVVRAVQHALREGAFGTARHLHAELGFVVDTSADDRSARPRSSARVPCSTWASTR